MLNFGYLKEKNYYIEKNFVVNNSTKFQKQPADIIYTNKEEKIKRIIEHHIDSEVLLNDLYVRLNNSDYNLIITNDSFLLLENSSIYEEKTEIIDVKKLKILNYYVQMMSGKSEINDIYFKMYEIFQQQNSGLEKKLLKKIK